MRFILLTLALTSQAIFAQSYRLGPGDQITVSVRDRKEIEIKPAALGLDGFVDLAYAGRIQAQGMTTREVASEVEARLARIVVNPAVTVEVTEFGSQPVSVLGAVNKPGVHQLRGNKSLIEVLSMAEGLKTEAGNVIKITRPKSFGTIPLANAKDDATGQFNVAEVRIKSVMDASNPAANIAIRPHDVITVPRAELVYVMGKVKRPGAFPLSERDSMSVLQAISMAEGIDAGALTQHAKILRSGGGMARQEITVDVRRILENRAPDQTLQPNDILFIPSSATKTLGVRFLDAGIQMATGIAIWRF